MCVRGEKFEGSVGFSEIPYTNRAIIALQPQNTVKPSTASAAHTRSDNMIGFVGVVIAVTNGVLVCALYVVRLSE